MKRGSVIILVLVLVISVAVLGIVLYKQGYLGGVRDYLPVDAPAAYEVSGDRVGEISKLESGDDVEDIEKDLGQTNLNTIDQDVLGVSTEAEAL